MRLTQVGIKISMIEPDGFTFMAGIFIGISTNILTNLVGVDSLTFVVLSAILGSIFIGLSAFLSLSLATKIRFLRTNAEYTIKRIPDQEHSGSLEEVFKLLIEIPGTRKTVRSLPMTFMFMFIFFTVGLLFLLTGPIIGSRDSETNLNRPLIACTETSQFNGSVTIQPNATQTICPTSQED
ncbi:MAG: hypothetical protein HND47_24730 [Chloroflexi bacterium]|nr:hypothetical protein [Chloroflexota bacterium]